MSQIHLVLAEEPYEQPVVLRAFANEDLAGEFAQKLRDYQLTQPEWPMTDEPDEVFAQKNKSMGDWRAAHPGGEDASWRRFFSVIHVPFSAEQPDTVKVLTAAARDVLAERRRQVEAEGWTPEHDDEHGNGQMARAAACYALAGSCEPHDEAALILVDLAWPWATAWWKPATARRDLVKAGALILAEIERMDRALLGKEGK